MTDISTKGRLLAEKIRGMAGDVDKGLDELAERIEQTQKAIPVAFEQAHAFIDHQQNEVSAIDDVLRTLSNLPLVAGSVSQNASPEDLLPKLPNKTAGGEVLKPAQQRNTVEVMTPPPGIESLPSGIPANIAAALNAGGK